MEPEARDEATERIQEDLAQALAPRYEILGRIGRGGMGSVFLAREPALKRLVAVKALDAHLAASSVARQRFEREARAAAALSHPNVIRIYGVGETPRDRVPFIVMQYVEGSALNQWQREHGQVKEVDARRIVGQVASALAAAHRHGFVHRDIKPGNILIEKETGDAFVADFGITAILTESVDTAVPKLTTSAALVGTPAYMSPEQIAREPVTPKSDMYSLGVVAYELLAQQLPFPEGTTPAMLAAHMLDSPQPVLKLRPDTSPEMAALVDRCLMKEANTRPTAAQVAHAMLPSFEAALAWPPPGLHALQGRARRLAGIALVSGVGALVLAILLAFPPEVVRIEGVWWERFGPQAGSQLGLESGTAAETAPWWWWLGPIAALVTVGGGLLWMLIAGLRARTALAKARALGWRWDTLFDVLADSDGRSGLLTTGTRECAALDASRRRAILQLRRWRMAALLVTGAWATVTLGLWAVLIVVGAIPLPGAAPLMNTSLATVFGSPVVLGVAAWMAATVREWRLLRSAAAARVHTGSTAIPVFHASRSDVTKWYETLPGDVEPSPIRNRAPRSVVRSLELGSVLVTLLLLLALTLVVASVRVAGRAVESLGRETVELVAALERVSGDDPLGSARQAWSEYLPPQAGTDDSVTRAWLGALSGDSGVVPYTASPTTLARSATGYRITQLVGKASRGLDDDTRQLYRMVSDHPRTEVMRRLARASVIDVVGAPLDRPLSDYASIGELPRLDYQHLRDAVAANALAAVRSMAAGDLTTAATRLGENAAFAEHFLRSPIINDSHWGAGVLREFALLPLAAIEQGRGNVDQATALRQAANRIMPTVFLWESEHAGLAANPLALEEFHRAVTVRQLLPIHRFAGLAGAWRGYCANAREILAGVSTSRTEAVNAAAADMYDVPQARALAELSRRAWTTETAAAAAVPSSLGPMGRLLPVQILNRISYCSSWLETL